MYDRRENEHQELFHLDIDPQLPVAVHIPSPLGRLGYFVFVRVRKGQAERLAGVGVRMDIGGLREDHVILAPGEGVAGDAIIPAKDAGLAWRCLGKAMVSRGDGTLIFTDWPADITRADVLICTWPRFIESGQADEWIAAQADPLWAPSGVPLGAIGGGRVDICRDGRFRNFSMNNNQDALVEDPDGLRGAYLAVTCDGITRDIASRPIMPGHQACEQLEFDARFPQAVLHAPSVFPGVEATITLSGPLCPHDLRRSSIPGFIARWEVCNTGAAERTITCRVGWPNLIGTGGGVAEAESGIGYGDGFYHHWEDPSGRQETRIEEDQFAAVCYVGTPNPAFPASHGAHYLGARTDGGLGVNAVCGDGLGEVNVSVTVPPGGVVHATMALAVEMPHWVDSLGVDRGHYWQNHFTDGRQMLDTLLHEADGILREAGMLGALLVDSTLPSWLGHRLSNCNYPLVTNSVFYRDGRFSINEGPTEMAGCYGTIDQRLAAHPATQLLFPQLNVTELSLFADYQAEDGGMNHDLGGGNLERGSHAQGWPDLTCSFIIQTARHAWSTGDTDFEAAMWPHARRALLRHAVWAEEGQGVAQVGDGLGTSYDGYHYTGTTGYLATLWLATLAVMEKWAQRQGDDALPALIAHWREAAITRLEDDLWNGQYYIAYGNAAGLRRETCHAGQLAGEVYARMLCGTDVLPAARLRSCIEALLTINGNTRFAIPPDEVDAQGNAAVEFGWLPYVEGFMLSAVAAHGDARLWPLWERMMQVVDGDGAHPCDTRLMYRPYSGEPSWGAYYMTAPASWLVYDAWLDFFYTPGDGVLRLRKTTPGRYPLIHPLFWATAEISDDQVTITIRRIFSEQPLTFTALQESGGNVIPLMKTAELHEGMTVEWALETVQA
ncbi:MAG: GH116 family glycosyl hydrolase [Armatimonadota bacterium]